MLPISTRINNIETKLISQNPCAGIDPKVVIETRQKFCTSHTIKPFIEALESIRQIKTHISNQNFSNIPQTDIDIKKLIIQLITILSNWDKRTSILAIQAKDRPEKTKELEAKDPPVLLATKIHFANVGDLDQFVCSTQFDNNKLETYTKAMQGPNTIK